MHISLIDNLALKKQSSVKRSLGNAGVVKYNHANGKFQPFLKADDGVTGWVVNVLTNPTHNKALVQEGTFDVSFDVHGQSLQSLQTLKSFEMAKEAFLANSADLTVQLQKLLDDESLDVKHVDALIATCSSLLVDEDSSSAHVAEHVRAALKALKLPGALDGDATQYDVKPIMETVFIGEEELNLDMKTVPLSYSPAAIASYVEPKGDLIAFMVKNDMDRSQPAAMTTAKQLIEEFHLSLGTVGSSDEIQVKRKEIPIWTFLEMMEKGIVVEMTPEIAQQRMVNNPKPKGSVCNIPERVFAQIKDRTLEVRVWEYFSPDGTRLIIVDGNNTAKSLKVFFDPANIGKVCVTLGGKLCTLTKGLIAAMINKKLGFTTLEGPQNLVLRQVASAKMGEEHTFWAGSDHGPLWELLAAAGIFGNSKWAHNVVLKGNDTTLFNLQKHMESGLGDQGATAEMILRDFRDVRANLRTIQDIPAEGLFLIKIVAHVLGWADGQWLDKNRDVSFGKFVASQLLFNVAIRPGMTSSTYNYEMVQTIITGHVEQMAGLNSNSDYDSEECSTALKKAQDKLHQRVRGDMEATYDALVYLEKKLKNFPAALRIAPFMIHILRGIPVTEENIDRAQKVIEMTKRFKTPPKTTPESTARSFTILKEHDWSLWKYMHGTISWDDNQKTFDACRPVMQHLITDDTAFQNYMALGGKRKPDASKEGGALDKRPATGGEA